MIECIENRTILVGIIGAVLIVVGSATVQAQMLPTFRTEFRTDAQWHSNDNPQDANKGRSTLRFIVNRAHLNLEGDMDEDLGYRMRLRWNESFAAQDDNTGVGLEYFFLRYQWSDGVQYRIGKHKVLQGGREGVHNPINIFQYSTLGDRIQHLYEVGVSTFYDLSTISTMLQDQYLVGQILNQLSGSSENQLALSYNFAWYASFGGGFIEPVIQYGIFPHVEENERDATTGNRIVTQESYSETFLSLGTLLNLDPFMFELDMINHLQSSYKDREGTTVTTHHSQDNTTIIIAGNVGSLDVSSAGDGRFFSPFGKWIYENLKQDQATGTQETLKNEFQLGSAFFPKINNHHFRWHVMFVYGLISGDVSDYSDIRLNGGVSAQF